MTIAACSQAIDTSVDEIVKLRLTIAQLEAEIAKFKQPPLVVCEVKTILGEKAMVKLPNNSTFYVNISPHLLGKLNVNDHVLAEQRSLTIVDRIEAARNHSPESFMVSKRPSVKWGDIGGLWKEIEELKEVIELPLKKPDLFKKIGIQSPKGVLLHGPPGCGKTLLAKALANGTKSTFIELVGSELVNKFIGDGAKLVKEIFQLAKEKSPSIIFIDEIDAIASQRIEMGTSAEREVQRTFMQLLAEIDGFENLEGVKIIAATNRFDILDEALLRPGRLDRLVEIGAPSAQDRMEILNIYTKGMSLKKIRITDLVKCTEGFSGADINLMCTEAGYFAIRENRTTVEQKDFLKAINKVKCSEVENSEYRNMFG